MLRELEIPVFLELAVAYVPKPPKARFHVMILNPDGSNMALMTAGPTCAMEFCEKTAKKHAAEYSAKWGRPTKVIPK